MSQLYSQSTIDTARDQILEIILDGLEQNEIALGGIGQTLDTACSECLSDSDVTLSKIKRKLLQSIGRNLANNENNLEQTCTAITQALTDGITTNEIEIQQIAAKSGAIPVGADLTDLLEIPTGYTMQAPVTGTFILDARNFGPFCQSLIDVLREIRDRLPGMAVELPGEEQSEETEDTDEEAATDYVDTLTLQPLVTDLDEWE